MAAAASTAVNGLGKGSGATGHDLFAKLAGEAVGIFILAIFADMSDELGTLFVVIMAGWFIIFISLHTADLRPLAGKV